MARDREVRIPLEFDTAHAEAQLRRLQERADRLQRTAAEGGRGRGGVGGTGGASANRTLSAIAAGASAAALASRPPPPYDPNPTGYWHRGAARQVTEQGQAAIRRSFERGFRPATSYEQPAFMRAGVRGAAEHASFEKWARNALGVATTDQMRALREYQRYKDMGYSRGYSAARAAQRTLSERFGRGAVPALQTLTPQAVAARAAALTRMGMDPALANAPKTVALAEAQIDAMARGRGGLLRRGLRGVGSTLGRLRKLATGAGFVGRVARWAGPSVGGAYLIGAVTQALAAGTQNRLDELEETVRRTHASGAGIAGAYIGNVATSMLGGIADFGRNTFLSAFTLGSELAAVVGATFGQDRFVARVMSNIGEANRVMQQRSVDTLRRYMYDDWNANPQSVNRIVDGMMEAGVNATEREIRETVIRHVRDRIITTAQSEVTGSKGYMARIGRWK